MIEYIENDGRGDTTKMTECPFCGMGFKDNPGSTRVSHLVKCEEKPE